MSEKPTNAYAADKALAFPERLDALANGGHPPPVHLHFIISDFCELSCPGCAYRMPDYPSSKLFVIRDEAGALVTKNPRRFFPTDVAVQVLDDCAEMGTKAIEFTGGGEPTAHPHFERIFQHALDKGLDCAVVTHGLRARKLADLLVQSKWVRVSIDAATHNTYSLVRPSIQGPQARLLDKVLDGVRALRETRDRLGTECTIGTGFVVQRENWREMYEAARLFRDAGADNIRISGLFSPKWDAYHAPYRADAEALERAAITNFHDDKFQVFGRFCEKVDDLTGPPTYDACHFQRFTTYLGGDGNLYRCCVTSYNPHGLLGNVVNDGGFKKVWSGLQQKFDTFDAKSCTRCQFNDRNRAIDGALVTLKRGEKLPIVNPKHPTFV